VAEVDWKNAGFLIEGDDAARSLYTTLENEIIPLYFDRNSSNIPERWLAYVKKTLSVVCPEFSTKRALKDYFEKLYTVTLQQQQ
jgi:glucan phosphorylase